MVDKGIFASAFIVKFNNLTVMVNQGVPELTRTNAFQICDY